MSKLKIGYFADGEWSHNAFGLINSDKDIEIKFICARFDSNDKVLESFAQDNDIDFLKHHNINSIEFIKRIKDYDCDLFVSMSFNQIFRENVLNIPKIGTINVHAGKLPFYRGRNVLNWVLINDEKEFGITSHFVDKGIDTGDIIIQRIFPITDEDDYYSLLKVAYVECAKILYDSLILIKNNNVIRMKQSDIHPVGFYCGIRKPGDVVLNWNQTSREIFNFVRALSHPAPKSSSLLNSKLIKINKVCLVPDAPVYKGIAGQVIGKIDSFPLVKTKDTFILIKEYEYEGVIKIGDRFNE